MGRWGGNGRLVLGVVVAVLSLVALRLAFLRGIVQPVRISGGSMAPSLPGEHFLLACGECGFACRWDAAAPPDRGEVVCPNCGFTNRDVHGATPVRGPRVLIDGWPTRVTQPRRFDLLALRDPADASRRIVKRLVGLPGESPAIRDGDLYLDGRLVRKSLDRFRSLAVLVHDADCRPQSAVFGEIAAREIAARWVAADGGGGWRERSGEFACRPTGGETDWLVYRSLRCFSAPQPREEEFPVLDNDAFNQDSSRQLNRVADLGLSCHVRVLDAGGRLAFSYRDEQQSLTVQVWPDDYGRAELQHGSRTVLTVPFPSVPLAQGVQIDFAVFDRRVVFAVEGRVILQSDLPETSDRLRPTARPLGIGVSGSRVVVRRLRVWRDVVWLAPHGRGDTWNPARRLADDEFWVLGDNSPISVDSRTWPAGSVRRKSLIGIVLR